MSFVMMRYKYSDRWNLAVLYISYIDNEKEKKILEKIYYLYRKQMFLVARSILNNEADAEDVVQDVFLHIVSKYIDILSRIENENDLRNYLLKSTKNMALNKKKKIGRMLLFDENEDLEKFKVTKEWMDDNFEQYIFKRYEYEKVLQSINRLDEKYKLVLYYHFVMELEVKKVAVLMNQSVSTTKKQLFRGKKKLLFLLEKEEWYDK